MGMRAGGTEFLAQEDKEKDKAYQARLHRTFLYNAFGNTVDTVTSKPFTERVTLTPEAVTLPEKLQTIDQNADLGGRDLTEYASDVFRSGVAYGIHFGLVDMPTGTGLSLQDEREGGIRPYFSDIAPQDLIGFKSQRTQNGEEELTQVRIREGKIEATGNYTEEVVEYIRVINAPSTVSNDEGESLTTTGTWELWRKPPDQDEFVLHDQGTHSYPGIPLTAYYSERVGFMEGAPPLLDLAELNLAHWQSTSDQQRNITHFVRLAILMFTGMTEDDVNNGIIAGVNRSVITTAENADGKYVEHSGRGIAAGQADLDHLEEKMVVLGMTPFMKQQGGQRTRIGDERVVSSSITNIQSWIRNLESFLKRMYEIAANWTGDELPEDFAVNIFNEFGLSLRAEMDIKALLDMRQRKQITHERFLMEVQRRGILGDDMDIDEEINKLELEDPMLEEPPLPEDPDDEEAEDEVEPEESQLEA
jgi:hypothetical protein